MYDKFTTNLRPTYDHQKFETIKHCRNSLTRTVTKESEISGPIVQDIQKKLFGPQTRQCQEFHYTKKLFCVGQNFTELNKHII